MRHLSICALIAFVPSVAHAGYDEYDLLNFASCTAYTLTDDTLSPNFMFDAIAHGLDLSGVAAQALQTDVPKLQQRHGETWQGWLLYDQKRRQVYAAACDLDDATLQCDGLGAFPLAGLRCRRPHGKTNSHCTVDHVAADKVKLYWVDTNEHEDESPIEANRAYDSDLARMQALCGKGHDGKPERSRER